MLRWLPIGTHEWNKFVKPEELIDFGEKNNLRLLFLKLDIISATYDYLNAITTLNNERFTWGDGDSIDRERVRDFLVRNYGYSTDFDGGSLWALDGTSLDQGA